MIWRSHSYWWLDRRCERIRRIREWLGRAHEEDEGSRVRARIPHPGPRSWFWAALTCGLEEEAVAFYPILVPIFLALGYDSIVCVGAIFLAGSMGTTFSTINPFSVVIASNAAGVIWTEGIMWRVIGCVVGGIVVISYLYWYCKKVKANPEFSYSMKTARSSPSSTLRMTPILTTFLRSTGSARSFWCSSSWHSLSWFGAL